MGSSQNKSVDFSSLLSELRSGQVTELDRFVQPGCRDVPQATYEALQNPDDFPPLESAIVPGDRIALAVDPNVPEVSQVVLGAIKAIGQTSAGPIDIVIGDEARQETIEAIRDVVGSQANVVVHHSSDRDSLRYLAADAAADPIYLNRYLVDADFVLPIVVGRPGDARSRCDVTGVFPSFADSASRYRYQNTGEKNRDSDNATFETAWLLGVHMIVSAQPTADGGIANVIAGTPDAVRQQLELSADEPHRFQTSPGLVVISMDGDSQQQTWCNAARAIAAASRHVEPGGVIVLWSQIDASPEAGLLDSRDRMGEVEQSGDGFPLWDDAIGTSETIQHVGANHRLLMHSRVDRELIESLGLGFIGSVVELGRLSESFDSCGVIRAAQFAGATYDMAKRESAKGE